MAKIKSVQYKALKLIQVTLNKAIDDDFSVKFEQLFTKFIKDLKVLSKNVD